MNPRAGKSFCHLFLLFMVGFVALLSHGQERTINGFITTFDRIPLINAEVKVKSSKQIVLSDTLGRFEVDCLPKDKLKVRARGFATRKVKVVEKTKIAFVNLSLRPGEQNPDLAVGYGHVKDKNKLIAASSLHSVKDNFSSYSNMYQLIQGRFPGVQISGRNVIIRGQSSVNTGVALIVVDGVESDSGVLSTLHPFDVKSIDVIKDGATAIYGSKGANGVVIITTKKEGD